MFALVAWYIFTSFQKHLVFRADMWGPAEHAFLITVGRFWSLPFLGLVTPWLQMLAILFCMFGTREVSWWPSVNSIFLTVLWLEKKIEFLFWVYRGCYAQSHAVSYLSCNSGCVSPLSFLHVALLRTGGGMASASVFLLGLLWMCWVTWHTALCNNCIFILKDTLSIALWGHNCWLLDFSVWLTCLFFHS
jgi:hypothetical protein